MVDDQWNPTTTVTSESSYARTKDTRCWTLSHRVGDILFHFHESTCRGQPLNSTDLTNQVALLYTLIEHFGANQVVGVPAFGNPLEHLSVNRVFLPEMLHSCLSLPYILHSSLSIGCLRVLSLPGTFSHKSSAAGGRNVVFATGGRYSNITGRVHPFTRLPKNGTHTAGSCLTGPLIVSGPFRPSRSTAGQAGCSTDLISGFLCLG